MDEIAHADFVERTITHDSDVAIDEAPFDLVPRVECRVWRAGSNRFSRC